MLRDMVAQGSTLFACHDGNAQEMQQLTWSRSSTTFSRWNSFSSATLGHSWPLSVMDILNLWNDDPEEVLLDLGFGCDEPDLSGRIPARFINHQSQAKGINLQVFLEAQKDRLDLEDPDVSNRFKQIEVLQHVTTAFSSLMGSSCSPVGTPQGKEMLPEDQERRRRVGMLFRRASKKSLSQIHKNKTQDLLTPSATSPTCASPESLQPPPTHGEKRVNLGLKEVCLCPLAEEQGAGPDPQTQPLVASLTAQECTQQPLPLRGGHPVTAKTSSQRKTSVLIRESTETDEINSFEESSVTGSYMGRAVNHLEMPGVIRIDSFQSDSSGFPEELLNPSLSQASPGPDLIKALTSLSGGTNDSKSYERPGSPLFNTSTSFLLSSSPTSPDDKSVLSSPCPSPGHSLVFDPHLCPVSLCLPKSELQLSETEKPPDQNLFQPASLLTLVCKYLSELQNLTKFQSPVLVPHVLSSEDKDAPSPNVCSLSNDSEGTACFPSSPLPAVSLSPSPNCDHPFFAEDAISSAQSNLSPGNTRSEWAEVPSHECATSASSRLSLYTTPDYHYPTSSPSLPLFQSLSWNTENNKKDSLIPICLSDPPTNTQKKEDTGNPLSPSCHSKFKRECTALPCLSQNSSNPICQSDLSSQSQDPHDLIDSAVERISDLTEQSISQQNRSCPLDDHRDPAPDSPVQDDIHVKMDHLSLESKDTLQMNGKGMVGGDRYTDTLQTQDALVYNSDRESSAGLSEGICSVSKEVCNQKELDPEVHSCCLHEISTKVTSEELRKVCQLGINGTESESRRGALAFHDDVLEAQSITKVKPKDLVEIDSLHLVFQTSVDGSEGENGDLDAIFQQLDTEGRVYWAEPINIFNPTLVLEESCSFETSDGPPENPRWPRGPEAQDAFSSTGRAMPFSNLSSSTVDIEQTSRSGASFSDTTPSFILAPFEIPDLKPSGCSVSVQMSSSPSSHIVHRKDIPFMSESKRTPLHSVLLLDTSTPFRAVQSWTDLQIQRNTVSKKLSHGALHTVPKKSAASTAASETTQRPTLIFSSSSSFPLLSYDEQSHDCHPGMARNYNAMSISVDKELWSSEEEVDRSENEDKEKLWEGNRVATMACYCTCDHQCTFCTQKSYNKQHTLGNIAYSLDELEEMMLCLQQFFSVLSNMEEQLSEDQAAVYSVLSDQDREKVRDIEELRRAVKKEAAELEMQLNELAHHYDDSLKMKMHRLLDEQSLLCSQLRVFLPGMVPENRTVATQCCLLPWTTTADVQNGHASCITWNMDYARQSPPESESTFKGISCSPTKADKLDIVGILQRLKESFTL